jgi:acetamidase/formamidase
MVYGRDIGAVDLGDCIPTTGPIHVTGGRIGLLAACRTFREMPQGANPDGVVPARSRQLGGFLGDPIMVISSALSTF